MPIARRLQDALQCEIVTALGADTSAMQLFQETFHTRRSWILVMSTGIAVRFLAGLPHDKHTDPAVVVLDEGCHHAIALLSGHEGGANELAVKVANAVCAQPVISTATESLRPLIIGIGCRRGVSAADIAEAVSTALGDRSLEDVRYIATVDIKKDEQGLLEYCEHHGIPLRIFSKQAIAARGWVTKPSEWVQTAIGLDGVCEPCALMCSPRGVLVVPKTTHNGVAVAVVDDALQPEDDDPIHDNAGIDKCVTH